MNRAADHPPDGCLAALAGFDSMTVRRLRVLLAHHDPVEAYEVAAGRHRAHPMVARLLDPPTSAAWRDSATRRVPAEWAERCRRLDVVVIAGGDVRFPAQLRDDPDPPSVLFIRGDLAALEARRVAIVGTRNATRSGRDTAAELGHGLAAEGVTVVSGLARGVDGAAHRGALRVAGARPAAVVANGPDWPYPRQHTDLWAEVCARGLLVSEWPPGTRPDAYRFPLRNRILAALSEIVVVVESRETGGSLITARAAAERDVTVMAVPGSVRNRAAAGTNHLLCDGAAPVTCVDDVLVALGLDTRRASGRAFDPRPLARGTEAVVLERCRRDPCTVTEVVVELGLSIPDAAIALAHLERAGWVREAGGWFEAVDSWAEPA